MAKIILICAMMTVAHFSWAQKINFETNTTWEQVKEKAQEQGKYIFIDAYATWCGPCKLMDQEVYTDSSVASYFNANFISIKIQMDSTIQDSPEIKSWYKSARELQNKYNVSAFPSFLFLTSKGEMLHRGIGFLHSGDFIHLAEEAMDPNNQYSNKISKYRSGKIPLTEYPQLVTLAQKFGDKNLAFQIGQTYKQKILDRLTDEELLKRKTDINFLLNNYKLVRSKDRFFKYCYQTPKLVDSTKLGAINWFITLVINQEEIEEKLWRNGTKIPITPNPNWKKIYYSIENKYGKEKADYLVDFNKYYFYQTTEDWDQYTILVEDAMQKYKPKKGDANFAFDFNNRAWLVFQKCNDKNILSRALAWSNNVIEIAGDSLPGVFNFYDTRANILHKLGRKKEALDNEQRAITIAQIQNSSKIGEYKIVKENIEKGLPTW